MHVQRFALFSASLVLAFAIPRLAVAQADLPMPTQLADLLPQDQIAKEFQNFDSTPFDEPGLAFQVLMRKEWKVIPVKAAAKADTKSLVPLLRIQNVAGDKFGIAIEAKYILLEAQVRARDWVDAFLLDCGYQPVKFQEGVYFGRETVDCLATFTQGGQKYVTRLMVFRDGNRMFVTAGIGSEAEYVKYAKDVAVSLMGFQLIAPRGSAPVESTMGHSISYPTSLKMSYPKSWLPSPIRKAPLGVAAIDFFRGEPNNPLGLIRVRLFSKQMPAQPDVPKIVASFFRELGNAPDWVQEQVVLDAPLSTALFPAEGRAMVVHGSVKGKPVEVQLEVVSDADTVLAIGLINSRAAKDRAAWMVNRGAFEVLTRSLSH